MNRQAEAEMSAATGLRYQFDIAAMRQGILAGDGQP